MTSLSSEIFPANPIPSLETTFKVLSGAPWGHVWYTFPKGTFAGLSGLLDNKLPALLSLPLWRPV